MRNTISRAAIAGLAALSLTASLFATAPAGARPWHGGGAHGGGWHGGGPHGGWHGGPHGGWHGSGWHGGGWAGPAIIGGLAAGALLAPYAYGPGYGYGGCTAYEPVYDAYGNPIGQRPVNVC